MYSITQTIAPTAEPVTVAEAKEHLAIAKSVTAHDSYIGSLITAARIRFERGTHRQLVTATYALTLDSFPFGDTINIPLAPLSSVSSVTYSDVDSETQTFLSANYVVDSGREPGRIRLAYSATWPATRFEPGAVTITFVAGSAVGDVSELSKAAIKLLLGHWFEHREAVVTGTISSSLPESLGAILNLYNPGDDWIKYN